MVKYNKIYSTGNVIGPLFFSSIEEIHYNGPLVLPQDSIMYPSLKRNNLS